MPSIEFSRTHSYLAAGDGISLPVFLSSFLRFQMTIN